MSNIALSENFVCSIKELHTTLIFLGEWSCFFMQGKDVKNFLQGQLTIDIFGINNNHHKISAQCNINGKVLSVIRLFIINDKVIFILRKSVIEYFITTLKKYSMFSNVEIYIDEKIMLLGITGFNARKQLQKYFGMLPDEKNSVIYINNIYILWFNIPIERFLLFMTHEELLCFKEKFSNINFLNDCNYWDCLEVASGFPIIDKQMVEKFMPQEINLDILQGINFNKGCYLGQESISKNYFYKKNKRKMYWLVSKCNFTPNIGSILEIFDGVKFFRIGIILSILKISDNVIWIQSILNTKIDENNTFYVERNLSNPFFLHNSHYYNFFKK